LAASRRTFSQSGGERRIWSGEVIRWISGGGASGKPHSAAEQGQRSVARETTPQIEGRSRVVGGWWLVVGLETRDKRFLQQSEKSYSRIILFKPNAVSFGALASEAGSGISRKDNAVSFRI
jgi:hypothetical protein